MIKRSGFCKPRCKRYFWDNNLSRHSLQTSASWGTLCDLKFLRIKKIRKVRDYCVAVEVNNLQSNFFSIMHNVSPVSEIADPSETEFSLPKIMFLREITLPATKIRAILLTGCWQKLVKSFFVKYFV